MSWLPGWNSIESTAGWASFFFWFGLAALLIVGISEAFSHYYSVRNVELMGIAESNGGVERQRANAENDKRRAEEKAEFAAQLASANKAVAQAEEKVAEEKAQLDAQLASANNTAAEAEKKVEQDRAQAAPRRLNDSEKAALIAALSPFHGQKVEIHSNKGDDEGSRFARDFDAVFKDSRWHDLGLHETVFTPVSPVGIEIVVSDADVDSGHLPKGLRALVDTLSELGLMQRKVVNKLRTLHHGTIQLRVGSKPPAPS
jgi:flagellar biosynthesis GTPase FlhF